MEKTLNESIINIRVKLQNSKLKKTGKNEFAKFDYFELADFLPKLNELMLEEKINDIYSIEEGNATLTLVKGDEKNIYKIPFVIFDTPLNKKVNKLTEEIEEVKSMQDIQYLGALNTYYKRYLYLNAFGITDGEIIDSMNNNDVVSKKVTKPKKSDIAQIDYKTALLEELKKRNINIQEYVKTHEIGAKTTQKRAYELLVELQNSKNDKNGVKNE